MILCMEAVCQMAGNVLSLCLQKLRVVNQE